MIRLLEDYFPDRSGEGMSLVLEQQPHPFDEYVPRGDEEGTREFRNLVLRVFRDAIQELRRIQVDAGGT
jgi:hypothetical protein